ncbi:unnamed protein product [Lactuca virosa]|uniref:Uncharacterized protein n=1 Tax=Lactuca virosa TaxID=75947 RepID=A0AAU9PGB4_9ASTR|nr:unnamed protein product [Lactuca virosa]
MLMWKLLNKKKAPGKGKNKYRTSESLNQSRLPSLSRSHIWIQLDTKFKKLLIPKRHTQSLKWIKSIKSSSFL